ncbi:MAG: HEPN domain-containing protein [Bryobacteraceae bacterium]|jgi:HEPN domain-containing protein
MRLAEAQALLKTSHADGAYYLAGYAVECALKACISKQTQRYDFPDRKRVNSSHTHDLAELVRVAKLQDSRKAAALADTQFQKHWDIVQSWSEDSRYTKNSAESAQELVRAIVDRSHGVMKWIKQYWWAWRSNREPRFFASSTKPGCG